MIDEFLFEALTQAISKQTEMDEELLRMLKMSIEIPPTLELGERSSNIAFKLAKSLRKSPFEIAETLSSEINAIREKIKEIRYAEAVKGYINFYFDFRHLFNILDKRIDREKHKFGRNSSGRGKKIIVEHTSINPVKPLHIGNLRNAILGDIMSRLYEWNGWEVEVQNLIDDYGRQVATLIWGLLNNVHLDISRNYKENFDVWLGRVYSHCNSVLEASQRWKEVDQVMIDMRNNPAIYRFMRSICQECVDSNLETAWKHGITYDFLVWESDISRSGIWEEAQSLLERNEYFYWEKEGENEGCFVAYLGHLPEFEDKKNPIKIFIRSNGVPTYVAHDVGLQLWKYGLVTPKLRIRSLLKQENEHGKTKELWTSTDYEIDFPYTRKFGNADRVCNVIGVEQEYLQEIVRYSLKLLDLEDKYRNSYHLSYKHVNAPQARFSGRSGNWYEERAWADAVLEDTFDEAMKVLTSKRPDLDEHPENKRIITTNVSIAALRYWLAKFSTETEIKFRIEDATSLEGDTGPFLLYSYVRAKKILEKSKQMKFQSKLAIVDSDISLNEKQLILDLYRLPEVIKSAADSFQPIQVTKYAFELSSSFNRFYETSRVINAESEPLKSFRIKLVKDFHIIMQNVLQILGIPLVDEM
ncbi:MAG: arginine--tRNA ligase [Candidatus Heimdallarchaeota archaeon]|nr:arginine--tRNA ligase [Candidatus Heimdallarchaeota archaeon]